MVLQVKRRDALLKVIPALGQHHVLAEPPILRAPEGGDEPGAGAARGELREQDEQLVPLAEGLK